MKFKVGDKVICTSTAPWREVFRTHRNEVLTVTEADDSGCFVVGVRGKYMYCSDYNLIHASRFEGTGSIPPYDSGLPSNDNAHRFVVPNETVRYVGGDVYMGSKQTSSEGEATKHDAGKAPLSLIPIEALNAEARVFGFGAKKYGKSNYKKGMEWSRVLDACLRHVNAYASGEDLDPESGESHLAHARCCLAMLIYYKENDRGTDDRE